MDGYKPEGFDVSHRLRDESGQAIMLLLLVAICMLLFVSLMYHTGAIILVKMKMQNTADVSAMTGAVVQARGMQAIARLNKEIVGVAIEANEDTFEDHSPFPSDSSARAYIQTNYLTRIEQLVRAIGQLQRDVPLDAEAKAREVAIKNLGSAAVQVFWRAPRFPGNKLVDLKSRKRTKFHYVRESPTDLFKMHRKYEAPTYYSGKTDKVTYTAVEIRVRGLLLGDELFTSGITEMRTYAAAKPFGGKIGGCESKIFPTKILWRMDLLPWQDPTARLWLSKWGLICQGLNGFHNPLDYDAWLVRIGDKKLNPAPVQIPDYSKFLH